MEIYPGGFRGLAPGGFRGLAPGGFRGLAPGGFRGLAPGGFRGLAPGGFRGLADCGARSPEVECQQYLRGRLAIDKSPNDITGKLLTAWPWPKAIVWSLLQRCLFQFPKNELNFVICIKILLAKHVI